MANKKLVFFSTVAFVFLFIIALGCAEKTENNAQNESGVSDSGGESGVSQASVNQTNETVEENDPTLLALINKNSPNVTVSISSPVNEGTVKYKEFVSGNSTGVYNNSSLHLYVLINPIESDEEWWIQPEEIVSSDGSWQTLAYFGENTNESAGKEFRVSAIVTSENLGPGKLNNSLEVECRVDKDILVTRSKI